jgi:hypothetical protein
MVAKLEGLLRTKDISDWEEDFITSISERVALAGGKTSGLSEKQVEKIERLYADNFGGGR